MAGRINRHPIDWGKWHFKDVEEDFIREADEFGVEYDAKHPFSFLPPDTLQKALKAVGSDCKQLAELMDEEEKTVYGWFRPTRNPSRKLVEERIFPGLCESKLDWMPRQTLKLSMAIFDHYIEGKPLPPQLVMEVEQRVTTVILKGTDMTVQDYEKQFSKGLDGFRRSAIHFAAEYLNDEELADLTLAAISRLYLHQARAEQSEKPDELSKFWKELGFDPWKAASASFDFSDEDERLKQAAVLGMLDRSCIELDVFGVKKYLERTGPSEHEFLRDELRVFGKNWIDDYPSDEWLDDEDW